MNRPIARSHAGDALPTMRPGTKSPSARRSSRAWLPVAAACISAVMIESAHAATIYVNNITGDDRANGLFADVLGDDDGPVATLRRAFEIAHASDAIVIANTGIPYLESVTLDRPDLRGTAAHPIVIEGNGATLRGAARLPSDVWTRVGPGTYRYQPFRKGHYQLIVNGSVATEVKVDRDAAAPPLEPLQWCAVRGYVYLRVEPNKFIDQYEIEVPRHDVGLGLHHARYVIVQNLNFEMYRLDGVAVTGNSRGVRLLNVRSSRNGRAGLSVAGTSQVSVAGLDLLGNRLAERLELMRARIIDLQDAEAPPKPAPRVLGDAHGQLERSERDVAVDSLDRRMCRDRARGRTR